MSRKNLIIAILLVFVVILSSSTVFAQNNSETQLQQADETAVISQCDDNKISSQQTITANSTSDEIQKTINAMSDGDTLNFEAGEYKDICIYINKNITVNGNGATLIGHDTPSKNTTPQIITNSTQDGGYAIGNLATLYIVKTTGVTISGLTIIGGQNSASAYSNALVYAMNSDNLTFTGNVLDGSSWGLYLQYCRNSTVSKNTIKNQAVTGILNFGSANTLIEENRIVNAENHGIDVRHGTGPDVKVLNNTVIGSKEGIYLMHSKGHTAANNTLINCTISSITCYGSSNIKLSSNKMQKSRIGILLGGGYSQITVEENTFALDNLPYPPTFVYYVAEAKADYQSAEKIMGIHSDSSSNSPNYVPYTGIEMPEWPAVDYDAVLKKTGTEYRVPEKCTGEEIQSIIDSMNNGDSLIFHENAVYENISIYTDKNIKIFGNNATLIGYESIALDNVAQKVRKSTADGGYAVAYRAVLYVLNTTGAVISDLNIKAQYPGYNTAKATTTTDEYKTAGIYAESNRNLVITGCDVGGASWGIFQQYSQNSTITKNNVHDTYTTGIMNFGSPNAVIAENTITDAVNHGIDVRHGTGPNVTVAFNTVTGAKEGIYLMHSKGHSVYNNTVKDCKISGITAYGSGNEAIFNNDISGSRIGILLGGGYYNVTIGENKYSLDFLPFPPTFVTYLAKADNKYQSADNVKRIFSDKEIVNMTVASNITVGYMKNGFNVTLLDYDGKAIANQPITACIDGANYTSKTNDEGVATIAAGLAPGTYTAEISFKGSDNYAEAGENATVNIIEDRKGIDLIASGKSVYLKTILSGTKYQVTLKANGSALVNKTVSITFNGKTYTSKTNADGVASFTLKATAVGSKKATVKFAGDGEYAPASKTATIKIIREASKLTAAKKTFKAKIKTKKYTITLKSKSNKAISKVKVTIKVNGKTYKATTNSKGKATLKITKLTKKGKFTATVKFTGNKYYSGITKKVKITVK